MCELKEPAFGEVCVSWSPISKPMSLKRSIVCGKVRIYIVISLIYRSLFIDVLGVSLLAQSAGSRLRKEATSENCKKDVLDN